MASPDPHRRTLFFTGQFLQEPDLAGEQAYHRDQLRRHNRTLHASGIVAGLGVVGAAIGAASVTVEPGAALDAPGQAIYLDEARDVRLDDPAHRGATVLVMIAYDEQPLPLEVLGRRPRRPNRAGELPRLLVVPEAGPRPDGAIALTRLSLDAEGRVEGPCAAERPQDDSVRVYARARLEACAGVVERLAFSRPEDPAAWPELASPHPGRLDLRGALSVTAPAAPPGCEAGWAGLSVSAGGGGQVTGGAFSATGDSPDSRSDTIGVEGYAAGNGFGRKIGVHGMVGPGSGGERWAGLFEGDLLVAGDLALAGRLYHHKREVMTIVGVSQYISDLASEQPWVEEHTWGQKTEHKVLLCTCQAWSETYKTWGNSYVELYLATGA